MGGGDVLGISGSWWPTRMRTGLWPSEGASALGRAVLSALVDWWFGRLAADGRWLAAWPLAFGRQTAVCRRLVGWPVSGLLRTGRWHWRGWWLAGAFSLLLLGFARGRYVVAVKASTVVLSVPASFSAATQAMAVAPVVMTSSSRTAVGGA